MLRNSADLAADSLRLTTLRYQAGEATALEVVDAQNTLTQARNNYRDGAGAVSRRDCQSADADGELLTRCDLSTIARKRRSGAALGAALLSFVRKERGRAAACGHGADRAGRARHDPADHSPPKPSCFPTTRRPSLRRVDCAGEERST